MWVPTIVATACALSSMSAGCGNPSRATAEAPVPAAGSAVPASADAAVVEPVVADAAVDPATWFETKSLTTQPFEAAVIDGAGLAFASGPSTPGAEVDVVDCLGWVAIGTLKRSVDRGWRVDLANWPDVRSACNRGARLALRPADPARQAVRTDDAKVTELPSAALARLPAEVQAWHAVVDDQHPERHGAPTIWSDLNGDGSIDLLVVTGPCRPDAPEHSYKNDCGAIVHIDGAAWLVIGEYNRDW